MRMRRRYWVYSSVLALAVVIAGWLLKEEIGDATEHVWQFAPFFGSMLLTFGWVVTTEVTIRNSKKQHTIGLINQHRFGASREKTLATIKKHLPSNETILTWQISDFRDDGNELLQAIDMELNFYDFCRGGRQQG